MGIKSGGTSVRLLVRRSNSGGKVPPLIDHIGGMSPLSPTPNPMMSATASVSALPSGVHSGLGHNRPVSAMSQPTASSMHLQNLSTAGNLSANISATNNINQQAPNGIPPHIMQQQSSALQNGMIQQPTYGGSQQYPNGGPMSHSSPRVGGDPYFWNQF